MKILDNLIAALYSPRVYPFTPLTIIAERVRMIIRPDIKVNDIDMTVLNIFVYVYVKDKI